MRTCAVKRFSVSKRFIVSTQQLAWFHQAFHWVFEAFHFGFHG
jgi:hypothetical protein